MKLDDFLPILYTSIIVGLFTVAVRFSDEVDKLQHQLDTYDYGCGYIEEPIEEQSVEKDDVDVVRNSKAWEI